MNKNHRVSLLSSKYRMSISILSFLLILVAFLTCYVVKSHESASYTLTVKDNVVTVDCGELLSAHQPMEFRVPLRLLGLSAKSVKEVKSSCKCAVAQINPEDKQISITYRPSPSTTEVSQLISLIPSDQNSSPRFVRLRGKLIPAWFAHPSAVFLRNLYPGEERLFSVNVEINYEMPKIGISSIHLTPKTSACVVETRIIDESKFNINGEVTGLPRAQKYKGHIVVTFDSGPFNTFELPLEISHTGTISAIPEVITLENNHDNESIVEFRHFEDLPLNIEKIDHPEYLTLRPVRAHKNKCLLKIELNNDLIPQEQIITSKVKITFSGIDQPGEVRVVVIPSVCRQER